MRILVFSLYLLSATATLAQSPLNDYLNSIRQGSYAPVPQALLKDTAQAAEWLEALPPYQNDTLIAVRSRAYNLARRIGQRSTDPAVRRTATAQLTRGIADPDAGVSGNNSAGLTGFRHEDFGPATQTQLVRYLQPHTPHLDRVAMLAGFVQPDAAPEALQSLLAGKLSSATRWSVYLALARTGDKAATDYILNKLATAPVNDALVYDVVPGLVYTRQPAIFDYLKEIILSDVPNCQSADPDSDQNILCGYRVMEAIAPALEGFPVATDSYGELLTDDYEQALRRVRAWLQAQEAWPMRTEGY